MSAQILNDIFDSCEQISPALKGCLAAFDSNMLHTKQDNQTIIATLFKQIQVANPNAGRAYWLTRTWDLLMWQPIAIAMISIYGKNVLPNIIDIAQQPTSGSICGFRLTSSTCHQGCLTQLITLAGKQLTQLFSSYFDDLSKITRIGRGLTMRLFADALMANLLKAESMFAHPSVHFTFRQAHLWLEACQLPATHLISLQLCQSSSTWRLNRQTCCLAIKTEQGVYCQNCPKRAQKKSI